MSPFELVETKYGPMIINRNDRWQYQVLKDTGIPHIEEEIQKILELVSVVLPKNAVIVDGGANVGLITIPLAKQNPNYTVIAFEPQPAIFNALCGSISLNGLENIISHRLALSDKRETLSLPIIDYNSRRDFGNVVLQPYDGHIDNRNVSAVRLDDMVEKVDFIKLDIEKMELKALQGAEFLIDKYRPWCWVEYIRSDLKELVKFFKTKGYNINYADRMNIIAQPNSNYVFEWIGNNID